VLLKVRVAGVQSFCVLPVYRGTGLSDRIMSITMEQANRRGFDTGLLFCLDGLETVYARMGWHKLDSEVYMRDDKSWDKAISSRRYRPCRHRLVVSEHTKSLLSASQKTRNCASRKLRPSLFASIYDKMVKIYFNHISIRVNESHGHL